jgi:hypothetical protein
MTNLQKQNARQLQLAVSEPQLVVSKHLRRIIVGALVKLGLVLVVALYFS